jgi:hypothetical protein
MASSGCGRQSRMPSVRLTESVKRGESSIDARDSSDETVVGSIVQKTYFNTTGLPQAHSSQNIYGYYLLPSRER